MVTQQERTTEKDTLVSIISRIPREWTSVKELSTKELFNIDGISKQVADLIWELLIDQRIIETIGKRSGIRYHRNIMDNYIDDAAVEIQQAIIKHGWEDKTFISNRKKQIKPQQVKKQEPELPVETITTRFLNIGEVVYLIHNNEPTQAVVKVAEATLDENGKIRSATYEVALAPNYRETIITNKIYPTKKSLWDDFTTKIFGKDNQQ